MFYIGGQTALFEFCFGCSSSEHLDTLKHGESPFKEELTVFLQYLLLSYPLFSRFRHKHMLVIQHILEFNSVQHQARPEQRLDTLFITHDHEELPVGATDPLEGFILSLEAFLTKQCDNLHHFNL